MEVRRSGNSAPVTFEKVSKHFGSTSSPSTI